VDLAWWNLGLKKVKLRLDSVDSLRRRVVWAVGSVENGFGGGI
jgi:hypothetical protein